MCFRPAASWVIVWASMRAPLYNPAHSKHGSNVDEDEMRGDDEFGRRWDERDGRRRFGGKRVVRSTKRQEWGPVTPLLSPEVIARASAQTRFGDPADRPQGEQNSAAVQRVIISSRTWIPSVNSIYSHVF